VTTLPTGESATALQWSQAAGALAVGSSSGKVLRFTCSSSSRASPSRSGGLSSGVAEAVTPAQAATQWAAAAGAGSAIGFPGKALPCWSRSTYDSSSSSSTRQQQQQQQHETVCLDGPVVRLCLEPQTLCEGVVSAGAASAWYVDLRLQQKAPLIAGHAGAVDALVPVGASSAQGTCMASLGQDGRLAIWQLAAGSADSVDAGDEGASGGGVVSTRSRGTAQVPFSEWCCPGAAPTAAVFLPGQDACVLGHADGRVALLELPGHSSGSSSSSRDSMRAGVLRWCVLRQPSAVVALALHPDQPLVMAASR
jgi:hypothetical protein